MNLRMLNLVEYIYKINGNKKNKLVFCKWNLDIIFFMFHTLQWIDLNYKIVENYIAYVPSNDSSDWGSHKLNSLLPVTHWNRNVCKMYKRIIGEQCLLLFNNIMIRLVTSNKLYSGYAEIHENITFL